MDGSTTTGDGVWRPSLVLRTTFVMLAVFAIVFGLACPIAGASEDALVIGLLLGVLMLGTGIGLIQLARMTITLTAAGVEIRNFAGVGRIEWHQIHGASAGPAGIALVVIGTDGFPERRPQVAMAVQKPNLATWTKRQTRADHLVQIIEERARAARRPDGDPPSGTP